MVITCVAVPIQPPAVVPVKVYVVVTAGSAITCVPVVAFNPVAGLHVYVLAPLAIIPTVSPAQTAGDMPVILILTVGGGVILTAIVVVSVHPLALVPTTV
jgi:hypothetical protein